MTIRDLMTYKEDIDVYSDTFDFDGWAICPPIIVTEEGEREWGDVLDHEVTIVKQGLYECALFNVGAFIDDEDEEQKTYRTIAFLEAQAGYCSDKDWDKWFKLED